MRQLSSGSFILDVDTDRIDRVFAALDTDHQPGAAIGIAVDNRPIYRRGFGVAEVDRSGLLSPTTPMRIASVTKQFAALAYMLLCEEGRAAIGDPVGKHLPELHPIVRDITMRQLMGNTGGHRDVHDICWQFSGTEQPVSSADLMSLYRGIDDVNAAPGTTWIYNNGGWLMLSVAIERITSRTLEDVLYERIFLPLGMKDTALRRSDVEHDYRCAALHVSNREQRFVRAPLFTSLAGEGGIVSTVDDMLRWLSHMDSPVIGTHTTWATMRTSQTLINGTSTGYGLGLMIGRYRGVDTVFHTGGLIGGNAYILKIPCVGVDVAIMVNRHDVSGMLLVDKILDCCIRTPRAPRATSEIPNASGIFRSQTSGRVVELRNSSTLAWNQNARRIVSIDGMDLPAEADLDGVLRVSGQFGQVRQSLSPIGDPSRPRLLQLDDFGELDELVAIEEIRAPNISAIAGHYQSDTTGIDIHIREGNDGPCLHATGKLGSTVHNLECLAERIWRAIPQGTMPFGGILSFSAAGDGFGFSTYQTRSMPFRRAPHSDA